MSLYGALRSGVSGLFSNSQRMAMISDNIANVNTTGYKRVDARFSTFVTSSVGTTGAYTSGGVVNYNAREVGGQGAIEPTNTSTDLAISGNGYFVVTRDLVRDSNNNYIPSGDVAFTRSGEFRVDANGNLRNSNGYYLLAWPRDVSNVRFLESNEFSSMRPVNINNQAFDPTPTNFVSLGVNLTPQTAAGPESAYRITQEIVDRQGTPRTVEMVFEKAPAVDHTVYLTDGITPTSKLVKVTAPNSWRIFAKVADASIRTYQGDGTEGDLANDSILVPIADVSFDSAGRLGALTLPGNITQYYRTFLPLSFTGLGPSGSLTPENGSISGNPYTIPNDPTALSDVRDILINAGINPATFVAAAPTETEILQAISILDTEAHPLAMPTIMGIFNGVSNFESPLRTDAGLPSLSEGIDKMFSNTISYTSPLPTVVNINNDAPGALALGAIPGTQEYIGARLVTGDGVVREITDVGTSITQLQGHARAANDRLRLVVDYDNSGTTQSDTATIDLSLGSLTMEAFDGNNILNRSGVRLTNVSAGLSGNDGLTQYHDDISTLRFVEQNGKRFASLQSVDVSEDGVTQGYYDDGETRDLFKIPLVTFANPNGLRLANGNVFEETGESGIALARVASTGGSGRILSSAREAAAVDLAEEFSNMIITQRAYSANTKIITTTDSMLEELTRSVR